MLESFPEIAGINKSLFLLLKGGYIFHRTNECLMYSNMDE